MEHRQHGEENASRCQVSFHSEFEVRPSPRRFHIRWRRMCYSARKIDQGVKFASRLTSGSAREPTSASVGRRRRRHIAQELIAAVTLDRGQVVRDQPTRSFDRDRDTVL